MGIDANTLFLYTFKVKIFFFAIAKQRKSIKSTLVICKL